MAEDRKGQGSWAMEKEAGGDVREMAQSVGGGRPRPQGLATRVRTSGFPLGGMRRRWRAYNRGLAYDPPYILG